MSGWVRRKLEPTHRVGSKSVATLKTAPRAPPHDCDGASIDHLLELGPVSVGAATRHLIWNPERATKDNLHQPVWVTSSIDRASQQRSYDLPTATVAVCACHLHWVLALAYRRNMGWELGLLVVCEASGEGQHGHVRLLRLALRRGKPSPLRKAPVLWAVVA